MPRIRDYDTFEFETRSVNYDLTIANGKSKELTSPILPNGTDITVQSGGSLSVNGSLDINAGASVTVNSGGSGYVTGGPLTVNGDLTINGDFTIIES